jgi:hypothetical protein
MGSHESSCCSSLLIPAKICSVNVGAAIVDDYVIGPYAILDRLGGAHYANFLEDTVPVFLEEHAVSA